ncbi:MAG: ATP-binding cassette domain-containing protein [Phaeodactylibacter sp.]|nr:ATP-binding cassette domain-containing protein [Phaeodactylibacter sp.]MCB9302535.1 ATP-binding cassette domain-containing protein [Lewinellaceae bacterium]HQU57893.1 ABC transporter transmembrane domain-containing protein [Saprospiraceae bacterium]
MKNSFWRILGYLRNYRLQVGLNIFSNILTALFTALSIPLLIPFLEILFDRREPVLQRPEWRLDVGSISAHFNYFLSELIVQQGKEAALVFVCMAILGVFFLKNLFRYLSLFFMAPVRNGIIRDIRQQLFDKVLILPLPYFSEERKGDLMSRITADVQEVEWSILNVLEAIFREPLIIVGSLAFMLYISPSLTAFVFILMIFTAVVIGGIGRQLKRSSSLVQEKLGVIVSIVEEALGGLRIIKGFNAEGYQREKFGKENNQYRWILTRLLWRRDLSSPMSEFLGIGTVAVLLWYGSKLVFTGELQAETFLTFIFAFYNVIDPAKSLTKSIYNIQKGIGAMERVERVLDAPLSIQEKPDARIIENFRQKVEYRNVSFAYRQEEELVLRNINLDISYGKVVALVGASGAGKSTLVDLLPRFYDVTGGGIYVDGIDIRDYSLHSLRNLMGIVSQEAILFNDSIYNNIVFGMEGVGMEEVVQAARVANAHDFIMATENAYETNIGDRGSKLSGGQRQRLTIARAILKNPPILILDEATSALDSESEKLVQEALVKLMKNRTSIVIAHRLSTIQHADEIVVMRAGQIVERGTHQSLLQQAGEYSKLVELQAF